MLKQMYTRDGSVTVSCRLLSLQKKRKAADGGGEGQEEMRVVRKYVS
jgi:hypothetical protein